MGCCCSKSNVDIFHDKVCSPCSEKGINSEAVQYCYDCETLLCNRSGCLKKHSGHNIGPIPRTPLPPSPTPVPRTPTPPPPRIPTPPRTPTPVPSAPKLVPAGEFIFKDGGNECCVTGYDVLPCGKIVIADGKNRHLYIFNEDNKLLCKLHVKWVLDVAALSDNKLAFVYAEKVVAFVTIGVRYRHMEIEREVITEYRCLRVRYNQERIYLVCIDYAPYTSFVVILNMNGMKLKKIDCPSFSMNFITISPSTNEIFVTGISGGIKVFNRDGNILAAYRDVDIQWYYGIASDKYGNVFVCTQDEYGPEVYMLDLEENGSGIRGLSLQLEAKHGLKTPYRLCYNPMLDTLLVGSNDFDVMNETLRMKDLRSSIVSDNLLPVPVELKDPDVAEQEARLRHALMEGAWGSSTLTLYKIQYSYGAGGARSNKNYFSLI